MKVWLNTAFVGRYPRVTGTTAVVVAATVERAVELLNIELVKIKLPPSAIIEDMQLIKTSKEMVNIVDDGDF